MESLCSSFKNFTNPISSLLIYHHHQQLPIVQWLHCYSDVEEISLLTAVMSNGLKIISPLLGNVFGLPKCSTKPRTSMSPSASRIPLLQCPPKIQTNHTINGTYSQPDKKRSSNGIATVIDILRLMDSLQFPIPADMYASLLKECTDLRDAVGGAEVHAHINRASPRPGILILNRLLLMYTSCGRLETARELFDKMTIRDSISWVTMIAGHVDNGDAEEALHLFDQMLQQQTHQQLRHKGLDFISFIIPCILRACIQTEDFELGKQVHGWVLKTGNGISSRSSSDNSFLPSLFVVFYGKFRCLDSARRVFDQLCHRNDAVMWTAMTVEYCREDHFKEAIEVFKMMGRAGIKKNNFTFSSVLRACGRIRDGGWCGRQVHANAIKLGVIELDSFVQSSLVDMYGKSGLLKDARVVFERICDYEQQSNNAVCWNAMLNNYTQQGFYTEAIKLLYLMKAGGMQPSESMVKQLRLACSES